MQAIQITDGRTSLWQWDTGVSIKVYGCTDVDQMHFVTPGGIISRELVNGECGVPDTALQTEGLLKMYAYDRTENGGVTRCDFLLMVKARPKPADYIDPPDEYDNLSELAKRVAPLIPGGGGEPVTPEQIQQAVDNYLDENPVQVEETDPTIPGWAKEEQKPTYTAEEVGALPADAEIVDQTARDGVSTLSKEIEGINKDLENIPTGKIAPDDTTFFLVFENLFNPDTVIVEHYINQAYGTLHANTSYNASDFIQVAPATTYVLNAGGESRYAFYDANKNFISGVYNTSEAPIEIVSPGNAEFFRFSFRKIRNLSDTSFAVAGIAAGDAPYINPEFIRLDTHSFPLNLPAKLYALVGEELNVWFDNLVDGHDTDYVFEANCSVGMQLERCYRLTAEEAGEYNLTIKAIDKHGASVTKTTKIIVAEADAGSGDTASLIVLGDSTTNNGIAIDKLNANFMTDAEPMGVTTLGTRGEGRNKHEGRSGWTFRLYFESAGDDDDPSVVNPFYNPITQTFDATYYFANSGVTVPKWFFVNLGINDTFSYYDDETLATCIETLNTYCDQMIASLKAAAPSIKIGVCLTIPPNYSQDAFGKAYKCGQTRNRYKHNNVLWVQNLIAKYDGREVENIYLVPIHTNLDTKYGMGMEEIPHSKRNTETYLSPVFNGGVHPETDGYWQIADVYWFFLKAQA